MSAPPPVTVLMPVYNGERYVRKAIESILRQTFTRFELLIVNDGSTDSTRAIVCAFDDPRVRLVDNPTNMGLPKSLNMGMRLARGAYVARQDADDISEPRRLERQYAFMEAHPDVSLLGCWYREIDMEGRLRGNRRLPTDQTELRWALLFYCPFVHSGTMLRKADYLDEIGLYDERIRFGEDHELWLRTSRVKPLTNYPEYLVRYRLNPHSMTETYGELTSEGTTLTAAAVASLMGWSEEDTQASLARFRKMFDLMYGEQAGLDPAEVGPVTGTVRELHRAFCAAYGLDGRTAVRHEATLRRWLSRRCIRASHGYLRRGLRTDAVQLYLRALRSTPSAVFTRKSVLLAGKLVLIEPVRMLRSRRCAG